MPTHKDLYERPELPEMPDKRPDLRSAYNPPPSEFLPPVHVPKPKRKVNWLRRSTPISWLVILGCATLAFPPLLGLWVLMAIVFALFMSRMAIAYLVVNAKAWSLGQIVRTRKKITGNDDDDIYIV